MKSKSIFLMAVSLGFGLVAAIGITQVMGRNKPEPVADVPKETVLVAVKDLDINTELTPELFKEEQWPAEYIPENVLKSLDEIEGKVVTSRVSANGTVTLTNLVNKSELRSKKIPPGYKVFGVTLGSDDHLSGLLEPGDTVDLIAVFRSNRTTGPSSQTFLRKVRIFNINANTSKDPEGRASVKGNTVVGLLVNEKQSEQIALVDKVADLKLAMRSDQENDNDLAGSSSGGTSLGDLTGNGESSNTNADGLARLLSQSFNASTEPTEPEVETGDEPTEADQFVMTIYTADGPTQYHFDRRLGNIPQRYEGFGGLTTQAEPQTEASQDNQDEQQPPIDLEGDEAGADSDLLIDELDSEPGA